MTGSKAVDTGIQQVTVRRRAGVETSREVSAGYYVLAVGDRLLVTKQSGAAKTTVEGGLEPLSADLSQRLFTDPEMQAIRLTAERDLLGLLSGIRPADCQ